MKKFFTILIIIIALCLGFWVGYKSIGEAKIKNYIEPSRVFITGNLHGKLGIDRLSEDSFLQQKELNTGDNLIILGDFGLIWDENIEDEMLLDELDSKNYNILFVDGSHENFDLLNDYDIVEIYGGKAHKIRDNIYHLIRGEIYTISGKKYLVFGGGESLDKDIRKEGVSYWKEEIPSKEDWDNLKINLNKYNNYVDYVLTYTPPSEDLKIIGAELGSNLGKGNDISQNLQLLADSVKYKKWYHSYYHFDIEISRKHTNIYKKILEIK